MATDYPNPEFVGIDCIALFPSDIRPPNVTFIKHDALKGLPFEDNSIDLVQLRLFTLTFSKTEWDFALKEAYRVTKPGGYIQILEAVLVVRKNAKNTLQHTWVIILTFFLGQRR